MTIYLIGLGLGTSRQLTLEALETAKSLDKIYLDTYTSFIENSLLEELSKELGERLVKADRRMLEEKVSDIIREAERMEVGILIPGDPLIATTHTSIIAEAAKKRISFKVIHGLSIYCAAVSASCLHAYKFGRVTTIPKSGIGVETCYRVIAENMERGLHTLVLLDTANGGLTIPEAIELLLRAEDKLGLGILHEDRLVICLARIGFDDEFKWAGRLRDASQRKYPPPPHSIIFPGELHFSEREALKAILNADAEVLDKHKPPRLWSSRIEKYLENVRRALEEMRYLSNDITEDLVNMARSYLEDAERFWESGDLFDALAAISYAEGLLDALRIMGKVEFTWGSGERVINGR
ncbi:MAG: diphthine synthase [Thaumarchaeota archaeon]|nr:diphthine synthase [Nitrososphaerota archaeon]